MMHRAPINTPRGDIIEPRRLMPPAPLADRRPYPSWPIELQRLHRSCLAAWETFAELDASAAQARQEGRPADALALDTLASLAYASWLAIETYAAPYVAQWERVHTA